MNLPTCWTWEFGGRGGVWVSLEPMMMVSWSSTLLSPSPHPTFFFLPFLPPFFMLQVLFVKITKAKSSSPHCSYFSSWASHFVKDKIKKQWPPRRQGGGRCVAKPLRLGSSSGCCNQNNCCCWLFNENVDVEANVLPSPSHSLTLRPICCQALLARAPLVGVAIITTFIVGLLTKTLTFLSPPFFGLSN